MAAVAWSIDRRQASGQSAGENAMATALLRIICPHCQGRASVGEHLAGKETLCPHCKRSIKVPKAKARTTGASAPAAPGRTNQRPPPPRTNALPNPGAARQSAPAAVPVQQAPTISCPNCGMRVQLAMNLLGQAVACPYCTNQFTVSPTGAAVPAPPVVQPVSGYATPQHPQVASNYSLMDVRTGSIHTPGEKFQHWFGSSFGCTLGVILAILAVCFVVMALFCGGCLGLAAIGSHSIDHQNSAGAP